jgi:hypothetical protein
MVDGGMLMGTLGGRDLSSNDPRVHLECHLIEGMMFLCVLFLLHSGRFLAMSPRLHCEIVRCLAYIYQFALYIKSKSSYENSTLFPTLCAY